MLIAFSASSSDFLLRPGLHFYPNQPVMTQHMRACALCAPVFAFASANIAAQENIRDLRENYNIGQTVTVVGVVTSDDNLGSVRYLQDASRQFSMGKGFSSVKKLSEKTAGLQRKKKGESFLELSRSVPGAGLEPARPIRINRV